ncbi:hypothetical protein Leryth_022095 [Lithospermum erythrorhizon]|nr:hypothetical protein Leryth_022095 [Lithospermum erythrorhizon]
MVQHTMAMYKAILAPIEYPTRITLPKFSLSANLHIRSEMTSTDNLGLSEEPLEDRVCNVDPPWPGRSIAIHLVDLDRAFIMGTQSLAVPRNPCRKTRTSSCTNSGMSNFSYAILPSAIKGKGKQSIEYGPPSINNRCLNRATGWITVDIKGSIYYVVFQPPVKIARELYIS